MVFSAVALLSIFPPAVAKGWLLSGIPLGAIHAYCVPLKIVRWIEPEGGPPAFQALVVIGAVLTWTIVFTLAWLGWGGARRVRGTAI